MPVTSIFVDDIGVGAGVTAGLRRAGYPAIPVVVSQAMPEMGGTRCNKLRDWLWWQCRLYFQRKRPCFTDKNQAGVQRLCDELPLVQYSRTKSKGEIQVESKDEMRKRLGKSPDVCDALNLTFYRDQIDKLDPKMSASEVRRMQMHRKRKKDIKTQRT